MYLCEVWYCCVTLLTGYLRQLLWRLLRHFLFFALTHDRLGLSFSAASSLIFSTTCWTDFCETWMEDGSGIGICGPALSWLESYLSKEHYASLIIILHQCLPVWSIEFPRALFLAHALLFIYFTTFTNYSRLFYFYADDTQLSAPIQADDHSQMIQLFLSMVKKIDVKSSSCSHIYTTFG